jgi:hypothetical protein
MPETGHDNTDQHATEVEQLLERIRSLEEQARKELKGGRATLTYIDQTPIQITDSGSLGRSDRNPA